MLDQKVQSIFIEKSMIFSRMNVLHVLVEDIKDHLKQIDNTHVFEANISEKPFSVLSR